MVPSFFCKSCNKNVSKKYIDNYIFNEQENTFYKDKNKISFEIEKKNSYRIHTFGNIQYAHATNQIINEIIKEIISDIIVIKKNKFKYKNIIKYISKINMPYPMNTCNYYPYGFAYKKKTKKIFNQIRIIMNKIKHIKELKHIKYIKDKKYIRYMIQITNIIKNKHNHV